MLVEKENFLEVLKKLKAAPELAVDTETTGLRPWINSKLFSVVFFDGIEAYYFDFSAPTSNPYFLKEIFQCKDKTFYFHNAKFDMAFLYKEGIEVEGEVVDTEVLARLEFNDHLSYSLANCAKRIGLEKSDAVEDYITEHGLWEWMKLPGKKTRTKNKWFDKVPLEVIQPYAEQDVRVTWALAKHYLGRLELSAKYTPEKLPTVLGVLNEEKKLTKTCFKIEKTGIKINRKYCEDAIEYEENRREKAKEEFQQITEKEFTDSGTYLAPIFEAFGEPLPKTDKGNFSVNEAVLKTLKSPIAKIIKEHRDAEKRLNTYFKNFLFFADSNDRIHANIRQAGTGTGRFSYSDPNLQNLNDESESKDPSPYPVRRAFIPDDEDSCLVAIDYNQMEFRLMLDYAGQTDLIDAIIAGHDPHQATADIISQKLNIKFGRKPAKTLNFGLLYGMGVGLLAENLGISWAEAKEFKNFYFGALPKVSEFIENAMRAASDLREVEPDVKQRFVFTWDGRRSYFPNSTFAYKAPNYIIQGGCSSVVKRAMNRIDDLLEQRKAKTRLLIQVHDELVLNVPRNELDLVSEVRAIMEGVYPYKFIPLTCSTTHSYKSWHDMVDGEPDVGKKERNTLQRENQASSRSLTPHLGSKSAAGIS